MMLTKNAKAEIALKKSAVEGGVWGGSNAEGPVAAIGLLANFKPL